MNIQDTYDLLIRKNNAYRNWALIVFAIALFTTSGLFVGTSNQLINENEELKKTIAEIPRRSNSIHTEDVGRLRDELEKAQIEKQSLNIEAGKLSNEIASLKDQLKQCTQVPNTDPCENIKKQLDAITSKLEECQRRENVYKNKIADLEKEIKALKNQISRLQQELNACKKQLANASDSDDLNNLKKEYQVQIDRIKRQCDKDRKEYESRIEKLTKNIRELQANSTGTFTVVMNVSENYESPQCKHKEIIRAFRTLQEYYPNDFVIKASSPKANRILSINYKDKKVGIRN